MTLSRSKLAAATAVAAAFSLVATPAGAIELPRLAQGPQAWKADALNAENRRHRGHYDDDWDIDGGDILAGVLILGGLAAIAGIANSGRDRAPPVSEPYPEPYPEAEARYQEPARGDYRAGGMAQAVDTCVAEIEAGRGPVGSVDRASRSGEGWYVAGELDGGTAYACWVDGSGRVTDIEAGDYGASFEAPADEAPGEVALAPVRKQAVDEDLDAGFEVAQAADLRN